MGDNRRLFSDNEKMVLFNEVDGRCPICGNPLTNTKNGQITKIFEVAHIYPANPRPVVDYFDYIHKIFIEMDKITPYKFETLVSQIRGFYCKTMQINPNQEFVYAALVEWLNEKTGTYSKRACEIVIAYFVQDCEVFS